MHTFQKLTTTKGWIESTIGNVLYSKSFVCLYIFNNNIIIIIIVHTINITNNTIYVEFRFVIVM